MKCLKCGQTYGHLKECPIGGDVTCSDEVAAVQPVRGLLQEDFPTVHEQLAALKARCEVLEGVLKSARSVLADICQQGNCDAKVSVPVEKTLILSLARYDSFLAQPEAKR